MKILVRPELSLSIEKRPDCVISFGRLRSVTKVTGTGKEEVLG